MATVYQFMRVPPLQVLEGVVDAIVESQHRCLQKERQGTHILNNSFFVEKFDITAMESDGEES